MSLVKKLSYHEDLLIEKEKILLTEPEKNRLSVTETPADDIEQWKKSKSTELAIFKEWLKKQPHLPQNLTDEHILLFLHSSYYSIEQAKARLDVYFTVRTHAPEIFTNRILTSKEMQKAMRITRISPMRWGTPEGHNVIYVDSVDPDVANFNFAEAMKVAGIAIDVLVKSFPKEEENIVVFDMRNSALAHVIKCNLTVLKKAMVYVQKAIPFRLTQVHVINAFPLIHQIQMLVKPFIEDKLSKMIHIHMQDNMSTLYEFIPKKYLPKEYGGESESLEELNNKLIEILHNNEQYLKSLESLVVDEGKRPGKAQTSYDVFGVEGSFRKLEID